MGLPRAFCELEGIKEIMCKIWHICDTRNGIEQKNLMGQNVFWGSLIWGIGICHEALSYYADQPG